MTSASTTTTSSRSSSTSQAKKKHRHHSPTPPPPVKKPVAEEPSVRAASTSLGSVLVNGHGRTLYTFAPDHASRPTCTGACAAVWPPLLLKGSGKPHAGPGVSAHLLGSDPYPGGGRVVTYDGWPLYRFSGDTKRGAVNGQDLDANGGRWYVISAAGMQIMHPQ